MTELDDFLLFLCQKYTAGEIDHATWATIKALLNEYNPYPPKKATPYIDEYFGWTNDMQTVWRDIFPLIRYKFTGAELSSCGLRRRTIAYLLRRLYDKGFLDREKKNTTNAYVYWVNDKTKAKIYGETPNP